MYLLSLLQYTTSASKPIYQIIPKHEQIYIYRFHAAFMCGNSNAILQKE
ncbi:hypothetical protein SAMN05216464_1221 [Mucilaginibacter pineti]|uniref:Uncharacterized protein n=1 Tax=Mucilaginibacter pineti TaxID=1391627 RepID=A0A1G7MKA5_9SPHI|nr:hypothetical protein SAMN05216464_1221 [Mucilaginibacter pineti]